MSFLRSLIPAAEGEDEWEQDAMSDGQADPDGAESTSFEEEEELEEDASADEHADPDAPENTSFEDDCLAFHSSTQLIAPLSSPPSHETTDPNQDLSHCKGEPKIKPGDPLYEKLKLKGIFGVPVTMGDLSNDVHPLYDDLQHQPGWLPAVRLASLLLISPAALRFWHGLLIDKFTPLEKESQDVGITMYQFDLPERPLSSEQEETVRSRLLGCAGHLHWAIMTKEMSQMDSSHAFTQVCPEGEAPFGPMRDNFPFKGRDSIVVISHKFAAMLAPENTELAVEERLRWSFALATTIVHETAHGLYQLIHPLPYVHWIGRCYHCASIEPFFSTQREIELGYALETVLWGGYLCYPYTSIPSQSHVLMTSKWPDFNEFTEQPTPLGLMYAGRRAPKRWETRYFVPMSHVQQCFESVFWRRVFHARDRHAYGLTRIPHTFGFRVYRLDWSESAGDEPFDPEDTSLLRFPVEFTQPGGLQIVANPSPTDQGSRRRRQQQQQQQQQQHPAPPSPPPPIPWNDDIRKSLKPQNIRQLSWDPWPRTNEERLIRHWEANQRVQIFETHGGNNSSSNNGGHGTVLPPMQGPSGLVHTVWRIPLRFERFGKVDRATSRRGYLDQARYCF